MRIIFITYSSFIIHHEKSLMMSLIKQITHWLTQHIGWAGILIMAGGFFLLPLTVQAQHVIGKHFIEQAYTKAQNSTKHAIGIRNPNVPEQGHFYLGRIHFISGFQPELEVSFDNVRYDTSSTVHVSIKRKYYRKVSYTVRWGKDRGKKKVVVAIPKLPVTIHSSLQIISCSKPFNKDGFSYFFYMAPKERVTVILKFKKIKNPGSNFKYIDPSQSLTITSGYIIVSGITREYNINFTETNLRSNPQSFTPIVRKNIKMDIDNISKGIRWKMMPFGTPSKWPVDTLLPWPIDTLPREPPPIVY